MCILRAAQNARRPRGGAARDARAAAFAARDENDVNLFIAAGNSIGQILNVNNSVANLTSMDWYELMFFALIPRIVRYVRAPRMRLFLQPSMCILTIYEFIVSFMAFLHVCPMFLKDIRAGEIPVLSKIPRQSGRVAPLLSGLSYVDLTNGQFLHVNRSLAHHAASPHSITIFNVADMRISALSSRALGQFRASLGGAFRTRTGRTRATGRARLRLLGSWVERNPEYKVHIRIVGMRMQICVIASKWCIF